MTDPTKRTEPSPRRAPRAPSDPARLERRRRIAKAIASFALVLSVLALAITTVGLFGDASAQQNVRPPANAVQGNASPDEAVGGAVPGGSLGVRSDADLWRCVRGGADCSNMDTSVSIPDKKAAVLVQSEGDNWRALRNGPLKEYGVYALGGMLALLVLFFAFRGRIRIEHGRAGHTIERFNGLERFGHWLLAVSFILLALTGLNVLYGRYFLPDLIGAEAFASLTQGGKWVHNNVAWAFMAGLILVFFMWVRHNIPGWTDIKWILKGGGLFVKGVHPDSYKFNAGQKLIFWSTILLGASVSASGVALLFPYETAMMGKTFSFLNSMGISEVFGWRLDQGVTATEEQQYQIVWHSVVSVLMIAIIVAHIYIGSVGMEGAFAAMGSGQVDVNWAKEHHNLWVEEVASKQGVRASDPAPGGAATPAE